MQKLNTNTAITADRRTFALGLRAEAPQIMSSEAARRLVAHIDEVLASGIWSERLADLQGLCEGRD